MEKYFRNIILLKIFAIFFLYSCESGINYQDLSGVSENVQQFTETYHDAVKRFEEWQLGDKIYGYPIYTETFDKTGTLVEAMTDSDYNSGPVITKYNFENGETKSFSIYNHEGQEIERGRYFNKSIYGWESEVINVDAEIVRSSVLVIESNRIKERIENDYVNELFFKYEYLYEDEFISTLLIWNNTNEGLFDSEPSKLNYEYLEFDQFGNWTMRLVYKLDSNKPEYIMMREYEYF